MAQFDLILRNGRVIDPANGVDAVVDVAFQNGLVAAVGPELTDAEVVRDTSGKLVVPGLIDMHTHVYWGGSALGVDAEAFCRNSGVTTAIDTGSAGPGNFAGFRRHVIERSDVRILAYLHVSHAGVFGFSDRIMVGESEDLRMMDPLTAVEVANANRDVIVGIKVRLGRHASGDQGMMPFEYALQVAEETGLPMMVHIDEPPPSYAEVVARLRPGDVLTHCFRPFPNTPLTGEGQVRAEVTAARERGVFFDIGHGMGSFSFDVARQMLANGFAPDTISSDIHAMCINGPAFGQVTTLSKFLHLGMPLVEVIRASTANAALALSRPDLGNFGSGSVGDAVVLRLEEGEFPLVDTVGEEMIGRQRLVVDGVVLNGRWWHGD
ncbi:MAG: amidohydrolase/deacetylase family metallohydrolase [Rhodobacteraceae bacterium]|nr:amidohydrolase/deacetylase family metallohydrolase [Paracoccaceae bacterium]